MRITYVWYVCISIIWLVTAQHQSTLLTELGDFYFYENKHEIQFYLDYNDLHRNAESIQECFDKITQQCDNVFSNRNCKFFIESLHRNGEEIDRDLTYIKSNKIITKRIPIFIPVLVGIGIMALIALLAEQQGNIAEERAMTFRNIEHLESQLNLTTNSIRIQKEILDDVSYNLNSLQTQIKKLNAKIEKMQEFNDLLHITTLLIMNHRDLMTKFTNFFNGNLQTFFFSIVNVDEFMQRITELKKYLGTNFLLPPVNPITLVHISQIISHNNKTHISISIQIPILNRKSFKMYELFPIPTVRKNTTFILYDSIRYFIQENTSIFTVPSDAKQNCVNIHKLTICNSLIQTNLTKPDDCTLALIKNTTDDSCFYRKIPSKNYIFKISDTVMYFHIIKPINIKLICNGLEKPYNLTKSIQINYERHCDVYKQTINSYFSASILSTIDSPKPMTMPQLQVYNESTQTWNTDILPLERYDIKFIKLLDQSEKSYSQLLDTKKKLIESRKTGTIWTKISNYFSKLKTDIGNFLVQILTNSLIYVLSFISVPLIIYLSVYLCCKIKRKRSSS